MFGLGVQELLLILLLVLIFFGAEKIPQLARSLGKGMTEFRKAQQEIRENLAVDTAVSEISTPADTDYAVTGNNYPEQNYPEKICPACQAPSPSDAKFCSQCGEKLVSGAPAKEKTCQNCGRIFRAEERFCPECGSRQETD